MSSFTTVASATTLSFSRTAISFTPCVLRPIIDTSDTAIRTTMLSCVMIIRSSPSRTAFTATTSPVRSVSFMLMMPTPPRFVMRYSSNDVRLPRPLPPIVSTDAVGSTTIEPMTRSSPCGLMPHTPRALRPIGRTFAIGKRIAWPFAVASITSSSWPTTDTPTNRSSGCRPIAMMPPRFGRENAESAVRFTVPDCVARKRYPRVKSRTGIIDETVSPAWSCRRFCTARPLL